METVRKILKVLFISFFVIFVLYLTLAIRWVLLDYHPYFSPAVDMGNKIERELPPGSEMREVRQFAKKHALQCFFKTVYEDQYRAAEPKEFLYRCASRKSIFRERISVYFWLDENKKLSSAYARPYSAGIRDLFSIHFYFSIACSVELIIGMH